MVKECKLTDVACMGVEMALGLTIVDMKEEIEMVETKIKHGLLFNKYGNPLNDDLYALKVNLDKMKDAEQELAECGCVSRDIVWGRD